MNRRTRDYEYTDRVAVEQFARALVAGAETAQERVAS